MAQCSNVPHLTGNKEATAVASTAKGPAAPRRVRVPGVDAVTQLGWTSRVDVWVTVPREPPRLAL